MDRKPFRILAVAGSLRQGSYNRGLLRAAEALAPAWVEVRFFDVGQLPFFNEDVDAAGDPEPARRFKDAIATSRPSEDVVDQLRALLKKAGLPDIHFHDLRHSAGILSLTEGFQELLVHRNSSMTIDRLGSTSLPAYKRL